MPFSITYTGNPSRSYTRAFASTEVSNVYFDTYTVGTGGVTVDVTSLTDAYGQAISFGTVKNVLIVNNDGTNNLTAGGGSNALFAALPVLVGQTAGSCVNLTTNLTVSGSTKIISLVASAGSILVDLFIVGS